MVAKREIIAHHEQCLLLPQYFQKKNSCFHRYQRGSRSLADNIKLSKEDVLEKQKQAKPEDEDDDEEYDIPDEIEEVIGVYDHRNIVHLGGVVVERPPQVQGALLV